MMMKSGVDAAINPRFLFNSYFQSNMTNSDSIELGQVMDDDENTYESDDITPISANHSSYSRHSSPNNSPKESNKQIDSPKETQHSHVTNTNSLNDSLLYSYIQFPFGSLLGASPSSAATPSLSPSSSVSSSGSAAKLQFLDYYRETALQYNSYLCMQNLQNFFLNAGNKQTSLPYNYALSLFPIVVSFILKPSLTHTQ